VRRALPVVLLAGVALLVTGVVVVRSEAARPTAVREAKTPTRALSLSGQRDPMAGLARDEAGAVSGAVRLTRMSALPVPMSVSDAVALQGQVATRDGLPVMVDRLRNSQAALDKLGARSSMTFWVAPLATSLGAFDGDRAAVAVWYVGVLEVPGLRATEQWRTVTYRLAWERGSWRVAAEYAVDGPTPQGLFGAAPTPVANLTDLLAGYGPVDTPELAS
jgi:hypothetical protein